MAPQTDMKAGISSCIHSWSTWIHGTCLRNGAQEDPTPQAWVPMCDWFYRHVCQCMVDFTDICAYMWLISQTCTNACLVSQVCANMRLILQICVPTCDWFHRHMCQHMTGWLIFTPLQSGQLKDFQISPVRRSHIQAHCDSQATATELTTCTDTRSHTQHAQVISCLCPKHKTRNSPDEF